MFLLTPPSPSRTKAFQQQAVNEAASTARFADHHSRTHSHSHSHSDHHHTKFNAENLPPLQRDPAQVMATSHRGLEHGLPPGTILPDPMGRQSQPPQHSAHAGSPVQSNSYESEGRSRSSWQYQAKTEEERRRQEEERRRQEELRVRQEELRLDQRKTEERMLRESIANGVHPNLVPLIFVGLGAGNVAGSGFEMAQQYIRQFQQVGQQVQNTLQPSSSPDLRRDPRMTTQPLYGALQQQPQPTAPYSSHMPSNTPVPGATGSQQASNVYPSPAYQSPRARSGSLVSASPRYTAPQSGGVPQPNQSALPRLTTNEAQVQYANVGQPVTHNMQGQPAHQVVNNTANMGQQDGGGSPSLFFHHWQPPATTNNSTPSGRDSQKVSPRNNSGDPSPRKRKAQGNHQATPAPSSGLNRISPAARSRSSSTSSRREEHRKNSINLKETGEPPLKKLESSKSDYREEGPKDSRGTSPIKDTSASEVPSSKDSESKPNS